MDPVRMRCIDLETTAMAPEDGEVIEIGYTDVIYHPDTKTVEIGHPTSLLFGHERPMPPDNRAIHHISPAELVGLPLCTEGMLRATATNEAPYCLVAHNWDFEGQWFTPDILGPTYLLCTYKVALRVLQDAPAFGNQALRYYLGLELDDALAMPPHRAAPDSYVTAHILAKLLETTRVSHMVAMTREPRFYATCPIGRHKGPWGAVPFDYLKWMVNQPTRTKANPDGMEADIQAAAHNEIEARRSGQRGDRV